MRKLLIVLALAGCSARGDFTPAPAGLAGGTPETIFVGTTRTDAEGVYGFERSKAAGFLRYDIAIPPERAPGEVNWPPKTRKPDAKRDFLMLDERRFDTPEAFRTALKAAMKLRGQTDAVIYVHGFNNTMAEGVYRVAQMHHDLEVPGVAVHYAWPSRGSALGYVYDRDSVLYSRSGLVSLISEVEAAGAENVVLVAHSMGSFLAMEAMRQMVLQNGPGSLDRVKGVVLIAPDLDLDVFRAQAQDIGTLPEPFVIFGSSRDRILNISATISGTGARLGNIDSVAEVADLNVTYMDTAAYNTGTGHLNLGENPALLKLFGGLVGISDAFTADARARVGLLPGLVLTVRNATEIVLAPVGAIAEGQ
ncbi:alpha/beta hydrolase [Rhodobacter sp. SY28-1]|uniref:alpha/beta hydrolase n=1 Tax=Rhodobacter sp. SY28-1 TaxID=2562317 RepID=UPI00148520BB|nr:alpha/beta fold hydrolase [Rhodobacter sp. SY28-1]